MISFPTLKEVRKLFEKLRNLWNLKKLNDFPRLLWFPEGRTQPQGEFQGNAKAEYLLGWLANQMGVKNQLYGNGKVPVDATQPQDQERTLAGGLIGAVQSGMKRCSAKKEAPAPSQK